MAPACSPHEETARLRRQCEASCAAAVAHQPCCCLGPAQVTEYLHAGARQFGFMVRGLQLMQPKLEALNIPFFLLKGGAQPAPASANWFAPFSEALPGRPCLSGNATPGHAVA